jgi:carboxylesterase
VSSAEAFAHDGSAEIGVLLCHGFTGSPVSMRPWADHLAEAGFTVRLPLLPGHGTHWRDLNKSPWTEWYAHAEKQLVELTGRCASVFVFGLSMGGALTLRLAEEHPEIAGIVLVNPSVLTLRKDAKLLSVLSKVLPSMPGIGNDIAKPGVLEGCYDRMPLRAAASLSLLWRVVRADLAKITQPTLLLHSAVDHVVEPENSAAVLKGIASADVEEVVLANSYHVATLDHDAPLIFDRSTDFAKRVHAGRTGDGA